MSRPAGSLRREDAVVLAGTLALAFLGFMLLVGLSLPKSVIWILVAAAALYTFRNPEVGFYALLANALIGLTHMTDLPRIGPLSVPIAFEIVLALAVLRRAVFMRQKLFVASPQHLLLIGLTFWMTLSLIVNGPVASANISAMKNMYLAKMCFFFLMTNILLTRDSLNRFLVVLMGCNAGLLVVSFLVRLGFFGVENGKVPDYLLRTSGLIQNPNNLAFDLTTMLVFSGALFLYSRSRRIKAALAALALADVVTILTTLSRSGFVSLFCVMAFIAFRLRRDLRVFVALAVVAIMGLLVLPEGLTVRFSMVKQIQDVNRLSYARVGLNTALHNPLFGVGLGNYMRNFDRYNNTDLKEPVPALNLYMDLAAQMGFPALVLYIMVFAVLLKRLSSIGVRSGGSPTDDRFFHHLRWALEAYMVNLAVFGLSGDVEFEYSVFAALGFGILLYREHVRSRGPVLPDGLGKQLARLKA